MSTYLLLIFNNLIIFLQDLESEILAKQGDVSTLNSRVEQLRGDSSLMTRISKIMNKYQALKNTAKVNFIYQDNYCFYNFKILLCVFYLFLNFMF